MKIRNMLRGISLLFLMVSGLSVFLNCKGPVTTPTTTVYTVTFNAQGGSAVLPLKVGQGKTIAKPTDPTKASFTFDGWYKESACTTPWNFATDTVTANITLYAKWTPVAPATVTVTFAVKDGHGKLTAKAGDTALQSGDSVKKDTEVTFTAEPDSGYAVESLSVNGETKSGASITVKADKNLTAAVKFKAADPVTYTVTFDAQEGSAVAPIKAEQGKTIAKPTDPTKASFTFDGWYKESACTTPWNFATDTVTADITLYAKWTPVAPATVTVTLAVKDGHGKLTAKVGDTALQSGDSVKKGTDITFTAEPDTNYEVDYVLINGKKEAGLPITVTADKDITTTVKFKAQGTSGTEFFTVTYNASPAGGGSISAKDANGTPVSSGNKIEKGTALMFTAVSNPGYDISGWSGDATAASDKKTAALTVTRDSSVTVTFTLKKYTVSFDAQNGSAVAPLEVEYGKPVEKPTPDPAKTGFTFGGWYKEKECKTLWNFATDTVTADITLYAKWISEGTPITIQFESSKMTCWNRRTNTTVNTGSKVFEHDELFFEATLSAGQMVDKWKVNGVEKEYETRPWFGYTVQTADASGGTITIDYKEKKAAQVTIKFDSSKMICRNRRTNTTVNTGGKVFEHDELSFEATLSSGQTVDKWKVNGVEKEHATEPWFGYIVQTDDVQGGELKVDYTLK